MRIAALLKLVLVLLLTSLAGCRERSFRVMDEKDFRQQIESRFEERMQLASHRHAELFGVFSQQLNRVEKEALQFLFACMPLSDLADYDGDYYLKMVRSSLLAREEMGWGQKVPTDLFRHFVLPVRVNNENLDSARVVFYDELKGRVGGMSMLEAALEVNHWCHEMVTYRSTDDRTSAPLATVRSAFGRCGEESTLTVAALRSLSIPARQVYVPKWAHGDDNHAWVEFWADGVWYYLGACEPEAVPNLGWFTEPARRAMLVDTRVFGPWTGQGRIEKVYPDHVLLNTLETYASTKELFVKVQDESGQPVVGASVEFSLFNYGGFATIIAKDTDPNGICSLLTGKGDLLVWASKGEMSCFEKVDAGFSDTLLCVLSKQDFSERIVDIDMNPPAVPEPWPVDRSGMEENRMRLLVEDSIRALREATFIGREESVQLALEWSMDPGSIVSLLEQSRGNWEEIVDFLDGVRPDHRFQAMELLMHVSEKDLRDTRADILMDHLTAYTDLDLSEVNLEPDPRFFSRWVLNPRVADEMLAAYRNHIREKLGGAFLMELREHPERILDWVESNIQLVKGENHYRVSLTPAGTLSLRVSDHESLDLFVIAVLRTAGIPARLEPGTGFRQYWDGNWWSKLEKKGQNDPEATGSLSLWVQGSRSGSCLYYRDFTLARLEDGSYKTLDYDHGLPVQFWDYPVALPSGAYQLVTGVRQPDGAVLTRIEFFEIRAGETIKKEITFR